MKKETTIKFIKNYFTKTFQTGYCDLQDIFYCIEPNYYNSGIYGWNCDIYIDYSRDIAITTGYRNLTGLQIPNEIIDKYSKIAKNILDNRFMKKYDEILKALEENRNSFFTEIEKLYF